MNTDLPVLITGEVGTGKSLIARAIHDFSDRRTLPFVIVGAADLATMDGPATVLSKARNGSILFDEVGDLAEEAQARIVRMLDSFTDNAPRVMATSQADLARRMDAGQFRQDLFYRLGGVTLTVPAAARAGRRHPASGRAFPRPGRARRAAAAPVLARGAGSGPRLFLARQRAPAGKHRAPADRDRRRRGDHAGPRSRRCWATSRRWSRSRSQGGGEKLSASVAAPPEALFRPARRAIAAAGPLPAHSARDRDCR